jgi:predicted transposase/invertase (TIGR01784 family)
MDKRFYPPKFDYVFKRIFGDQRNIRVLKAFLMAVLGLSEAECGDLTIIDPHLKPEFPDDKLGILDVKVRRSTGEKIDMEIQVKVNPDFRKRVAFNAAKMLAGQAKRGDGYQQLERVVGIIICEDTLLSEEKGYYNRYSIRNDQSGSKLTDLLELIFLEPSKLPAEFDGSLLYNWMLFFKAETREELAMIAQTDPAIAEAVDLVMEFNEDEAERARADSWLLWQMDQAAREKYSKIEGMEEGRKETEAKYQPVLEENQAIKRENEELRRKLREAGIAI